MIQFFYIYVIYSVLLQALGLPNMYRLQYRCTRDQFDYYDNVYVLSRENVEKHKWLTLPEHINTCEVPYYMAYCVSKPFTYYRRTRMIPNHYHMIPIRNKIGLVSGSYQSTNLHPFILFDILCVPSYNHSFRKRNVKRITRRKTTHRMSKARREL
jgi:hypothetical protein